MLELLNDVGEATVDQLGDDEGLAGFLDEFCADLTLAGEHDEAVAIADRLLKIHSSSTLQRFVRAISRHGFSNEPSHIGQTRTMTVLD